MPANLAACLHVSEPTPHGIDLKNPFTMSNTGSGDLTPFLPVSITGISFSSSSKISCRVVLCPLARQSQRSCALWARFVALAALTSFALVEPIGIEPMT